MLAEPKPQLRSNQLPKKLHVEKVVSEQVRGELHEQEIMGCGKLEFCPHSLNRLAERSITREQVIDALLNPTKRNLRADSPKRRIAKRLANGQELHVVFLRQPPKLIVVTAYVPD